MIYMQHLVGRQMPDVELEATSGNPVNPAKLAGAAVIFCYPWTGRPGYADPPHWDEIPGAHGSTPQAKAYSDLSGDFRRRGVSLFGLSLQDTKWQREFIGRNAIAIRFLSDEQRRFSGKLGLPLFETGGVDYLQRLTLITRDGVITSLRYPIAVPEDDAAETLRSCTGSVAKS